MTISLNGKTGFRYVAFISNNMTIITAISRSKLIKQPMLMFFYHMLQLVRTVPLTEALSTVTFITFSISGELKHCFK